MENREFHLSEAHHPDPDFIEKNCIHYYCDVLSIASVNPSLNHVSAPFSHFHEAYEFLLPYGPVPLIMYDNTVYFGENGYVYPVQSGHIHASKFPLSNVPHDSIVIEKDFLEKIMKQKGYEGYEFEVRFELLDESRTYIQLFKNEFDKGSERDELKMYHLSALIAVSFIDCEFQQIRDKLNKALEYQKGILQIVTYMNQHYKEHILIEDLASMCGLSKTYFISAFKKMIGQSPYNYLLRLRISYSRLLLETTTHTVKEIAMLCGFQKSNTFTSLFKSMTGYTPSQYRKKLYKT